MNTYLLLIIGMVFWGMYPILTHYFVASADPLFLASISVFLSSLPFIIKLIFKKELGKLFSKKVIITLLPVALFGGLGYVFLFHGTSLTTGANTGILLQIEPIYALFIGVIVFREKLGVNRLLATSLPSFYLFIVIKS